MKTRIVLVLSLALAAAHAWAQVPAGGEFQVNTFTTSAQRNPSLASDAAGRLRRRLGWAMSRTEAPREYFAQRYSASGAPRGSEFRVNTYTSNSQFYPSLASDAAGNFVVVWGSSDQDGDASGVFGQRYDASGATRGLEFRVNSYTTNSQAGPTVAADGAGNFVVVWQSAGRTR